MPDEIRFDVPLPPVSLRANSRAHWAKKKADADAYSEDVWTAWVEDWSESDSSVADSVPWDHADVTYVWYFAGVEPDHGNLGGNVKYLQDSICMAPKNYAGRDLAKNRWYLGLVGDDRFIHATYQAVKVPHRTDERVEVTIRRRHEDRR